MGNSICCLIFFSQLAPSDWIDIIGILINSGLAFWIVRTIQNKLTNRRVLKDYFINEIKNIRDEYGNCLSKLYSNNMHPKMVTPWFKLMNIKVNDLMSIIHEKYKIDKNKLSPYQIILRELITNNDEFINQYNNNKPIEFSEDSRIQFIKFQQENNRFFNDIIISINDAD